MALWILILLAQPRDAEAWQRLGLEQHLRNDFPGAIRSFEQALKLNPALWTSDLFLGIGYYRTNRFTEALVCLERAHGRASGQGLDEAGYWLGAARIALGKTLAGLQALEELLARRPGHVDALELAARTYGDHASALWNHVAEHRFDSAAGYQIHGYALEAEGNRAGAQEYFEKSKRLAPRRAGPGRELGRLNGDRAMLEAELKLAPADARAHHLAGLMAAGAGDWDVAVARLRVAMAWYSWDAEPPIALASVLLGRGQAAEAAAAAAQAVEADPASEAAHELLVTALSAAGQPAQAERERARWTAWQESRRAGAVPAAPRP
ncbi:MAG: tetratricopeptide repeat protein [Acidobacteria bacterium]|nr:tetratricopeptide repeat protein [Acidobacteriota bacterium]